MPLVKHPFRAKQRSSKFAVGSSGSIFANFELRRLSTEERLFLHAARLGDSLLLHDVIEQSENSESIRLNVNCVDYMGRNALHLAVDSENMEAVELLMDHIDWECMHEALLHAISIGSLQNVRSIVDHPNYLAGEKSHRKRSGQKDVFFRAEETYQYPPDITPLILAAHRDDHEIIQLFLSRGHTIERPHAIYCQCQDCLVKQNCDSLKRSRSRLNAYKALASPAYISLSSPDPITTTFELRQEMMQVAEVEKDFAKEYLRLVETCMVFANELMDLCQGTQEVEAVLGEDSAGAREPLARLRLAIHYNEKKFVAHPNCQQHLTSLWYGQDMGYLQSMPVFKKAAFFLLFVPAIPFLCLAYILNPNTKLGSMMKCPVSKFLLHTVSHFCFLFLLAVATFGVENVHFLDHGETSTDTSRLKDQFRPLTNAIGPVFILISLWVIGLLWIECKQIYCSGAKEHFSQYYNYMDFAILALYLSSYALRFVAKYRVDLADRFFNATIKLTDTRERNRLEVMLQTTNSSHQYFMYASRYKWSPADPEIVADILFAVANVLSFARTTYVMPAHELLGPLQISLGRMIGDIARFVVLFLLVLFSFMVGMTNLYRYYGSHVLKTQSTASETFKGLVETVHTLFFSIFGLIALDKLKITVPDNEKHDINFTSTDLVDRVGQIMFAVYQISVTIVLVNMLIAMMSHSFEAIQGDCDVEWKFARTKLWMNYIDETSTLPVPFNMIPTPKSCGYGLRFLKNVFWDEEAMEPIVYDFSKRRGNVLPSDMDPISASLIQTQKTTYSEILQRLVRRYLFKRDRQKQDREKSETITREYCNEDKEYEELKAIREEEQADKQPDPPLYTSHNSTPTPSISPIYLTPEEAEDPSIRKSVSSETIRSLTRRPTMRRSNKRRSVGTRPSNIQLDAIQRGQKMLDARLQDLQCMGRTDESSITQTIDHMRKLLLEMQKAMGSLVIAMTTTQEDIRNVTNIVSTLYNKTIPEGGVKLVLPGQRVQGHSKSNPVYKGQENADAAGAKLHGSKSAGVLTGQTEGKETPPVKSRGRLATIKMSLRRKKKEPHDDPTPL